MIWYQYIFLALAVACYSLKDIQSFWGLGGKSNSFFGDRSSFRKYKKDSLEPRFFGSTTFLVWLTDGVHLFQMLMKWFFAFGIFGITWGALIAWICWTGIQWGVFKLFSK